MCQAINEAFKRSLAIKIVPIRHLLFSFKAKGRSKNVEEFELGNGCTMSEDVTYMARLSQQVVKARRNELVDVVHAHCPIAFLLLSAQTAHNVVILEH